MKSQVTISGNRLQVRRSFEAPRPLVFSWWTTPEKLQQWSGCKEATNCEVNMDFRVGGSFVQKLQIAGRGEFTIFGTYEEIIEPERIVYRAKYGPVTTRVTVDFFVEGKGTQVIITQAGLPEAFSKTVSDGTTESLEALAPLIASQMLIDHI
jgi:uncharacterized protein YndB with AHSA1/START domain